MIITFMGTDVLELHRCTQTQMEDKQSEKAQTEVTPSLWMSSSSQHSISESPTPTAMT